MFEKLIVSTGGRRSGRTARFFFGTSIIYLIGLATMIITSVLMAAPKLSDMASRDRTLVAPSPPPAFGRPAPAPSSPQRSATQPSIYHPAPLDKIGETLSAPPTLANPSLPPSIGPVGAEIGAHGGTGGPSGFEGALRAGGGIGHDTAEAPPRPTEPPATKPQTREQKFPLRVSTTVLQGKAVERVSPAYPAMARQVRLQGAVSVEVIISPEGRVESARAINGHPVLARAAVEAAGGWRFQPTLLNDTPVRVTGVITFIFKLE